MESWHTLSQRLQTGTAIDQLNQNAMMAEIERWRNILRRLLAIIIYLAERNLAFRGSTEKLYEHGNGNFLGQVQLMAKFDPFMKEHLRRIQEKELSDTYLSKHIQNVLITHVAKGILDAIVEKVKRAKYYAIIMDCTPDISHNEQLSVVRSTKACPSTSIL